MRIASTALFLTTLVLLGTNASAATGHWYCTGDGIKSWTSNTDTMDAHGWSYSGDRTVYKDGGHCQKG
jgi:hypothetical protein